MRDGDEILGLSKLKATTTRTIMAEPDGPGGWQEQDKLNRHSHRLTGYGGQAGRVGVGNKSARVGYAAYQESRFFLAGISTC